MTSTQPRLLLRVQHAIHRASYCHSLSVVIGSQSMSPRQLGIDIGFYLRLPHIDMWHAREELQFAIAAMRWETTVAYYCACDVLRADVQRHTNHFRRG